MHFGKLDKGITFLEGDELGCLRSFISLTLIVAYLSLQVVIKSKREEMFRMNKEGYSGRCHVNCKVKSKKELVMQRGERSTF